MDESAHTNSINVKSKCPWKNNHGDCDLFSETGNDPILKSLNCDSSGKCQGECDVCR